MRQTNNLHVVATSPLITPTELKRELSISERVAETVATTRDAIRAILQGEDRRMLAVVGPCSIHDVEAARDYAEHLLKAREEFKEQLLIVMRVYSHFSMCLAFARTRADTRPGDQFSEILRGDRV